jgi:hypothetical protein
MSYAGKYKTKTKMINDEQEKEGKQVERKCNHDACFCDGTCRQSKTKSEHPYLDKYESFKREQ